MTVTNAHPTTRAADRGAAGDLVIVANRLPLARDESGWTISPGGLVTAVEPITRRANGTWIGWHGVSDEVVEPFEHDGLSLIPIPLSARECTEYYEQFSNTTLWPLYHGALRPSAIERAWWATYRSVNERFAEAAATAAGPDALVWVHDYHLQLVPAMVRARRPDTRIAFFLHTPFPPVELLMRVPWRRELVDGLLAADLVGFQTDADRHNFVAVVRRLVGVEPVDDPDGTTTLLHPDGRDVQVATDPISVDAAHIADVANDPETSRRAARLRTELGSPPRVILGVDRLDYTKGIEVRLRALRDLLRSGRVDPAEVAFVQVATPSREDVEGYGEMRTEIEQLVGAINGDFSSVGRPVVHYLHQTFDFDAELVPMYLAADVMAVTPYRDGMNLVAKEYVMSRVTGDGCLLLSEFAGAADELRDAVLCNPFDHDDLHEGLERALRLPVDEQRRRMAAMRRTIESHDVHDWARSFLQLATT